MNETELLKNRAVSIIELRRHHLFQLLLVISSDRTIKTCLRVSRDARLVLPADLDDLYSPSPYGIQLAKTARHYNVMLASGEPCRVQWSPAQFTDTRSAQRLPASNQKANGYHRCHQKQPEGKKLQSRIIAGAYMHQIGPSLILIIPIHSRITFISCPCRIAGSICQLTQSTLCQYGYMC